MAEGVSTPSALSGRQKAAILCVALGSSGAANVFKHLSEEQVERLTVEMARTRSVDSAQSDKVRRELIESINARGYISSGGLSFARDVLERSVGQLRASEILGRLGEVLDATPFDFLRGTSPDQIFAFVRNEHPQAIALVLANLPTPAQASSVLQLMAPELQADVATRIALMERTAPDVVKQVAAVMQEKVEMVIQNEYTAAGGVESLADILNSSDRGTERNILDHLTREDAPLAEKVRALLFVFEDILKLDDRSIQLILKEVDSKDLAVALRGASEDVIAKILANMSQRGSEMLREEMEYLPPQRRRAVEEAQSKIVAVVRRLEDAGTIVIARGDNEDEMVI
jgi:flagellar motor switch protein FliG